ncbi:MAG: signal peptidase I [Gaiellaceae bacterium]
MEAATALTFDPALFAEPEEIEQPRRRLRLRLGAVLAVLVLATAGGGLAYLKAWPPMATVMSGSMEPTIKTGDVVLLKHLDRAPRVGDVIAVSVPELAQSRYGYPPVVIHRVMRIAPNGDITTKGDARPKPDPFSVKRGSATARVVATIPAAGHVFAFFTSTLGLVWLAGGVLMLVVLPIFERQRDAREREENTLASLQGELRAISEELAALRSAPQQPPPAFVADLATAVDDYVYCFEVEFSRALDELSRENDLS